eukprot:gb/GECH01007086.1/.p1 GENE.gb/GECH01007086.1/~~gb/GECH01007086.1/.p1  ORF type:complete len:636 (+),score=169.87 gb/GECH01007086.1/:1-1908(+)
MTKKRKQKQKQPEHENEVEIASNHTTEHKGGWQDQGGELVPPDRMELSEKELEENVTKLLEAKNPQAPDNTINFTFQENEWKSLAPVEHAAFHFKEDGNIIHVDTDEAKKMKEKKESGQQETRLRNQFNFSDRAGQTYNNPSRERSMETDPPPAVTFSATATQWDIYDSYMEQKLEAQKKEEKERFKGHFAQEEDQENSKEKETDILHSDNMMKSVKVIERMVLQNTYSDITYDFKYWDDPSDSVSEAGKGSLLPMWKFNCDKMKKKHTTAILWNPVYPDLFLVCYGSYNFMKQFGGGFCCFSLKNPVYPEYTFSTSSGILCGDFHPRHPSLIALGLYDGTVLVYDVRQKESEPIYQSTVTTGKHKDPVWQVKWQESELSKDLTFISVSSDGNVIIWTLGKSELQYTNLMELKASKSKPKDKTDIDALSSGLESGSCMEFSRFDANIFLVGTEEGNIKLCSKSYSNEYLEDYKAHFMAVYRVSWNHFHRRVFISASEDWTVKIWDTDRTTPVMTFDLGSAVGDVAWSPYSSTVFAAVTTDGKVRVFDLSVNKYEALCEQVVVKKHKLTHVSFNPQEPMILVGDERGTVISLKLSPNLRIKPKIRPKEDGEKPTKEQHEVDKLESLLEVAKSLEAS